MILKGSAQLLFVSRPQGLYGNRLGPKKILYTYICTLWVEVWGYSFRVASTSRSRGGLVPIPGFRVSDLIPLGHG